MGDDKVVVHLPKVEPAPEELIRRQMVEAERLARLAPGEWQLWIDDTAAQLGIPRATLEASVKAIIAQQEKDKRERKAEEERDRRRAEKAAVARKRQKERAFKTLEVLPETEQEKRIAELAKGLDEDPAVVREEFATSHLPPVESERELWPEAVEIAQLLSDMVMQIRRYVVMRLDGITATVLFTAMCWIHNAVATHSPILGVTSSDPDSGKSTLLSVLEFLVPKPFRSAELTGAAAFHTIDHEHPTMIVDEADDLFLRKKDLAHVINQSWTRGTPVARTLPGQAGVHRYDVFCPKIIGLKGMKVPGTTASRFITIKMWPRLPEETIEDFSFVDAPEFVEICRKLLRWSADNAVALGDAKPEQPPGFHNRAGANWRLLFAIADQAGGDWPKRARQAAVTLSRQNAEPSQGRRLLAALREIFANRDKIPSAEVVKLLAADPNAEWCEFHGRGSPITQRQLAVLLREYEIYPVAVHPTKRSDKTLNGYRRAQFADAWARFLPRDPHIRTPPKRKYAKSDTPALRSDECPTRKPR
jgi:putative DNA primase/helicase